MNLAKGACWSIKWFAFHTIQLPPCYCFVLHKDTNIRLSNFTEVCLIFRTCFNNANFFHFTQFERHEQMYKQDVRWMYGSHLSRWEAWKNMIVMIFMMRCHQKLPWKLITGWVHGLSLMTGEQEMCIMGMQLQKENQHLSGATGKEEYLSNIICIVFHLKLQYVLYS